MSSSRLPEHLEHQQQNVGVMTATVYLRVPILVLDVLLLQKCLCCEWQTVAVIMKVAMVHHVCGVAHQRVIHNGPCTRHQCRTGVFLSCRLLFLLFPLLLLLLLLLVLLSRWFLVLFEIRWWYNLNQTTTAPYFTAHPAIAPFHTTP